MPLNYSKWDALELSDDSDIEGHPNVDHKSLVRWKQRDIHEKREARKRRIAEYESILGLNAVLIPRVKSIMKDVEEGGPSKYSAIVEQLTTAPSAAKPPGTGPNQPSYDTILGNMLLKIREDLKTKGVNSPDTTQLTEAIQAHLDKMVEKDNETKEALEDEQKEQKKKITSEDIHEGFSSTKMAEHEPEPAPKKKATKAKADPAIEVLNPGVQMQDLSLESSEAAEEEGDNDEPERVPDLNPTLLDFSKIKVGDFETSWRFIQAHPKEFKREGVYDELVIAGFRAAIRGERPYARQCIHQALIIQYCDKLGKDGVSLFFKRMFSGDPRARQVFDKDFEDTFKMMASRAENAKKEEEGKERIQLVAEDSSSKITFNIPDGPPPENLKLEGPGTEGLDIEEVRKALQARWEIFDGFPVPLKNALKTGKLEEVNDVLGEMEVVEAEEVVKFLEIAGILSFSKSGVVDETGKSDGAEPSGSTADAPADAGASSAK